MLPRDTNYKEKLSNLKKLQLLNVKKMRLAKKSDTDKNDCDFQIIDRQKGGASEKKFYLKCFATFHWQQQKYSFFAEEKEDMKRRQDQLMPIISTSIESGKVNFPFFSFLNNVH